MTIPRVRYRRGLQLALPVLVLCIAAAMHAPQAQRWTPDAISSPEYETTPTFTPDGREMVFFRADPGFRHYRLFQSTCRDGRWSPAIPVPFAAPAPASESDPAFTPDGRRLYYISTRHAPGGEDFDIWYVDRTGHRWSSPRRLPPPINSPASELLPRVDRAGRLYFGSSRAGGLGGGDIYVATKSAGAWRVVNIGAPVNTAGDEYEAEVSRDGRTLIVVADRGDKSHLYRFGRNGGAWIARGRIPARPDVFQVGPLLSPRAERLLFAQADGERSGEMFVTDLVAHPTEAWPPHCGDR